MGGTSRGVAAGVAAFCLVAGAGVAVAAVGRDAGGPGDGAPAEPAAAVVPAPPVEAPPDIDAPALVLGGPADGGQVDDPRVHVEGVVEHGAQVRVGDVVVPVGPDGRWAVDVDLVEGENTLVVTALDAAGNVTTVHRTLRYEKPAPPPPPAPKAAAAPEGAPKGDGTQKKPKEADGAAAFHASQAYGSCGESPPYDEFSGTAVPGSTVKAVSSYGSASVTVGDDGHWALRVEFPAAPVGKTFPVTVKSTAGGAATFSFLRTA